MEDAEDVNITLNPASVEDYRRFLKIKSLPQFRISGRQAWVPDEYAKLLGGPVEADARSGYQAHPKAWDYQRDITALAIRRQKFAVFADCGLGKTMILLEYARYVRKLIRPRRVLIVSPLMVTRQTIQECLHWYGKELPIEYVPAIQLGSWLEGKRLQGSEFGGLTDAVGITNYESLKPELRQGKLGALIADESSMLKSAYGKWGQTLIRLGRGLDWKLALTGTPAPNDRIEYANHAVFLDAFPTVNSFLGRFFVNRGQTDNRWEIKPHALKPFYRALSHWCIFLSRPAVYGWKDNAGELPPIHVHIDDVDMTPEQRAAVIHEGGNLYGQPGGITSRSKLAQIAKGHFQGKKYRTNKPAFIRSLVDLWPDESTIIWCLYDREQDLLEREFPEAASLRGSTKFEDRQKAIEDFKAGRSKALISKSKILGFGLNLQIATRQVFSGLQDSYEMFYQCIKRSNRYGAARPLNVHIPITDVERPMVDTVLKKAQRVEKDTLEQEELFKECGYVSK